MPLQDILDRAFAGEETARRRVPDLGLSQEPEEVVPPITPVNYVSPEAPPQGPNMAALAMSLLGQQGGGGGGGGGMSDFSAGGGAGTGMAQRIGSWIDSRPGFTVGGLEGYNGTGQISSGHIDNSQHYTGHAGDVSYVGGGRFGGEMQALDWLYNKLNKRWGDELTELIWRAPDHYDHLHYGTRPGG